jgi:hypothetical protein
MLFLYGHFFSICILGLQINYQEEIQYKVFQVFAKPTTSLGLTQKSRNMNE